MKAPEYQEHVRETVLHLICDDQLEVFWGEGIGLPLGSWGGAALAGINSLVFNLPKNVRETVLHFICDDQLEVCWIGFFQRDGGGGSLFRLYKNNAVEKFKTCNKAPEYQEHVRETVLHLIGDDQLEVLQFVGIIRLPLCWWTVGEWWVPTRVLTSV